MLTTLCVCVLLFRCLERLLHNWDALCHFFTDDKKKVANAQEKKKKQVDGDAHALKKVEFVSNFLKSPTNRLYCEFLHYTLRWYDQVRISLYSRSLWFPSCWRRFSIHHILACSS